MDYNDEFFMAEALKQARLAYQEGEIPVGAVVVYHGKIIGSGHNSREKDLDISGHAEINAIKDAESKLGRWSLEGCTLYVTLEPCLMCAGAIRQSRLKSIVYGATDPREGAVVSAFHAFDGDNANQLVLGGVMEKECQELLASFFAEVRQNQKSK